MSFSITQKDLRSIWRGPLIWLVLAIITFISSWLVWQMLDRYVSLQSSFSALPNPPNITDTLWQPFVITLAQLMMLPVALTTGLSLAQERAQQTLWYLLINRSSSGAVIWQKFKAQLVIVFFAWLMMLVVALLLINGGDVNLLQLFSAALGMALYVIWLSALGLMISAALQSTGTAVLLNLLVFILFWLIGYESNNQGFGLNWLLLLSPVHHLRWLCSGEIGVSSLLYFLAGAAVFLKLAVMNLNAVKKS
ncbi:ABC transporter permease [Marinicella sp. S1101]|uniref:ABC transporter permease n=1 Tax=Marinicella marina TaxID=2996016 RepID=UPI002260B247|nr:ABC transporter permease [Marinicella marina]MCX7555201.1 ABC transporter permease [Marinicella marina]MDJ1140757.1 ABC transporter permease [Marinicella marina]